ncbi:hypothetical protein C0J52_06972, partial [Blattella germanica]
LRSLNWTRRTNLLATTFARHNSTGCKRQCVCLRLQYKIFMIYEPGSLTQLEQYQWTYWTERGTTLNTDLILFMLPMVHM